MKVSSIDITVLVLFFVFSFNKSNVTAMNLSSGSSYGFIILKKLDDLITYVVII